MFQCRGNVFLSAGRETASERRFCFPCHLTALRRWPVTVEAVGSDPAAAEELRPVDGVVVAEPGVLADVHAAVADLAKGAQAQGGQGGDVHHHQGETPAGLGRREARERETPSRRTTRGLWCPIGISDAFDSMLESMKGSDCSESFNTQHEAIQSHCDIASV